jgi:cytochrome c-type biogenesis protein CcsB
MIKQISDILFSTKMMLLLLAILGIGAATATFIENDYGISTARVLIYNSVWYELALILTIINLIGIIYQRKMWRQKAKFIFHISFVVMLIGAGLTRYIGYEGIMHIKEGQTQNQMISLEPYMQITIKEDDKIYYAEFKKEFSAIGNNAFHYSIGFNKKTLHIDSVSYKFAKKGKATMNLIGTSVSINGEKQIIKLVGQRGVEGLVKQLKFKNNININISYGSKKLSLPFAIKLNDFQLDRYPGSMSPSSYASEVTVVDKNKNSSFDFRIFMNSTLKYGGYQFFQSSYDSDETGTILSVNNDPGTIPTYLGYFLLTLGLIMNMFDKKSRFAKLINYSKQFNSITFIFALSILTNINVNATQNNIHINKIDKDPLIYLKNFKKNSLQTANLFAHLVNQSSTGRMEPIDSLTHNILNKLTRKSTFLGMNSNQIILGMLSNPKLWRDVKMLKIKTPKLKRILGIEKNRKYLAFSEIFSKEGKYKLKDLVSNAFALNPNKRGTFEKDIIKLDERINIAYLVYYGNLFQLFPKPFGYKETPPDTKWYNPIDAMNNFEGKDKKVVQMVVRGIINNIVDGKFLEANKYINLLDQYQQKFGKGIIPKKNKIDNEILFNNLNIFVKLILVYMILGIILFIVSFLTVFNKKLYSPVLNKIFFGLLFLAFLTHTFGMGHRWYISGHAPWSDTYESLIYISWATMFAGMIFARKSLMALSATVIMAGIFIFTAHLTGIDPQITNLVPVLKSYWLTIHVSIITGSYGFLAIGAMMGFMSLILFIFRNPNKPEIDKTIQHIAALTEASLIIGLALLIVGNFIGGIWANESWGRYWGWDPKETWAYISIVFYALILHLRIIPKLNKPFVLSVASTLVFSTILMTYFGVNFYLSGMHSYATGDPVPIPTWVYYVIATLFIIIVFAQRKSNLPKLKL